MVSKAASESVPSMLTKEAMAVLQAAQQERKEECIRELTIVLERYKCNLVPVVTIVGNKITAQVQIVPN